ncbi:hypothetical protein [Cognatilysobacter lacus]|uniref:Uncharacterized protein n=1 Tax=Cognatilysobacter lacus TaxID=1643323 RepID=A0A5D8YCI0_9GAMM|nr:hypothetical protein [Lysobacter lacus]TZF80150.1 hypothetical protein FW784_14125 [Lysobacter lacus]
MAAQTRRAANLAALVAAFLAIWLVFRDDIGLLVFAGVSLAALLAGIGVLAGRTSKSRLCSACRALADAFWGIG